MRRQRNCVNHITGDTISTCLYHFMMASLFSLLISALVCQSSGSPSTVHAVVSYCLPKATKAFHLAALTGTNYPNNFHIIITEWVNQVRLGLRVISDGKNIGQYFIQHTFNMITNK